MKPIRSIRPLGLLASLLLLPVTFSHAQTTYTWTNGGVANDIDDPDNWDQATAPAVGSKIGTAVSTDIIRFDSESATLPTANIDLVRITSGPQTRVPYFELLNGSLNINRAENWQFGGRTFTIGDGDMTTLAQANFNGSNNLNRDGGSKTYVINPDGTLKFNANFVFGQNNTVIRLLGGDVDAAGRAVTADFTNDGSNYVAFETLGSTFTANYGGQLPDAPTVQAQIGSSFRLGGALASNPDASLTFTDNGTSFTVGVQVGGPDNSFADWIDGFDVGGQTGFTQDPDGDGLESGLENFFGSDPSKPSVGVVAGTRSGNTFTFIHPENANPADDLSDAYRWTKDLVSYHADGATDGEGTTVAFTTEADTPSPGFTRVTATVTGTATDTLFMDVQVTQTP